jgi:hypothetical protein
MDAPKIEVPLSVTFSPEEFCMLARIVDEGMWELASKPHTKDDERLWDRVCAKLQVHGYTTEDRK